MRTCLLVLLLLVGVPAMAADVSIEKVAVTKQAGDLYHFDVTLRHADTGWQHYANVWEVVSKDGQTVYGKRTLWHPHVNEQPFTRSLGGVRIPADVRRVWIRAGDTVHGIAAKRYAVDLP